MPDRCVVPNCSYTNSAENTETSLHCIPLGMKDLLLSKEENNPYLSYKQRQLNEKQLSIL